MQSTLDSTCNRGHSSHVLSGHSIHVLIIYCVQALRNVGYVAPDDEEQLPAEANSLVPVQNRLYCAATQWDFEMQHHRNEHNVIATCKAITILAEAFLTVCCTVYPVNFCLWVAAVQDWMEQDCSFYTLILPVALQI